MLGVKPKHVLHQTLLIAIRDGADQIVCRPDDVYSCKMFYRVAGQSYKVVPPSLDQLQELTIELARLEPGRVRWVRRLIQWIRRPRRGNFEYAVGPGSVAIAYRVRWERGRVAELEIKLDLAPTLKEAVEKLLNPPKPAGFESIED